MIVTDVRGRKGATIDPPRTCEFEDWAALWNAYLQFYGVQKPQELFRRNWERIHDCRSSLFCLLARTEDGTPVGLAHFLFQDSAWCEQPVCYLQDLFVSEQCRGEGFGAALLLAVAAAAKDASAAKLYWLTQADNLRARELYDRVGRQTGFVKYEVSLSPAQMRGSAKSAVVK